MSAAKVAPSVFAPLMATTAPTSAVCAATPVETARPCAALTLPCSDAGARASSMVEIVGETMPIPRAATAHPIRPGTSPMTSSESRTGPIDPVAMRADPRRTRVGALVPCCTRSVLESHEPRAHRVPVTDSETPACAVLAPWVCTSISGITPPTAVKAAAISRRTAMTVGTPRTSRAVPRGRARAAPITTTASPPAMTAAPAVRVPGAASRGAANVVTASPAARRRAAAGWRFADAAAPASEPVAPPAWVRRRAGRSRRNATGATSRGPRKTTRHPAIASSPPARLGPRSEGRIHAAAKVANTLARSCSGSA